MSFSKLSFGVVGVACAMVVGMGASPAWGQCVPAPSGLVSWWDGDAISGTTVADIQGSNDGTLVNGATTTPGLVGDAFSFDGVNDYIRIPASADFDFSGDFSISYWFNTTSTVGFQIATFSNPTGSGAGTGFVVYNPGDRADVYAPFSANWVPVFASGFFNDNQWHYLNLQRSGATVQYYIDAVLRDTKTLSGDVTSNSDLLIGFVDGLDIFYAGLIDEVSIYNRALSASEIQAIFNAGSAGKCKCTAPVAFASLTLLGSGDDEGTNGDDDEGLFLVDFGIGNPAEACEGTVCTGVLVCGNQSIAVQPGEIIEIEIDDEGCEIETEDGFIEIEGPDVFLEVTCTNSAGSGTLIVFPEGLAPDNDAPEDPDD